MHSVMEAVIHNIVTPLVVTGCTILVVKMLLKVYVLLDHKKEYSQMEHSIRLVIYISLKQNTESTIGLGIRVPYLKLTFIESVRLRPEL